MKKEYQCIDCARFIVTDEYRKRGRKVEYVGYCPFDEFQSCSGLSPACKKDFINKHTYGGILMKSGDTLENKLIEYISNFEHCELEEIKAHFCFGEQYHLGGILKALRELKKQNIIYYGDSSQMVYRRK
jgi:hypothetical protein